MTTDLIQEIKKRRSIRKYKQTPVKKEVIEEIIQAGKYAPSAKDRQPWRFIVITDGDTIQDISRVIKREIKKILKKRFFLKIKYPLLRDDTIIRFLATTAFAKEDLLFFNAPVLIFIVTENKLFNDQSCACCAQNMMLAAHSLSIGSCWVGFAQFLQENETWLRKIGVPKDFHISAALIFGYPEGEPIRPSMRKPLADVINWIS